jgi:5'-nucleotidase
MEFLLDFPSAPYAGQSWQAYFDFTFVDARKPSFFAEGTVLRQVNKATGQLSIGSHRGLLEDSAVYSGGSSEVLSKLIGARGRDVLYVGDHIFGDVLKSKKLRGWRTFLIVPELNDEFQVWTSKHELFAKLQRYDTELSELYRNMDSSDMARPNVEAIKGNIRETIQSMEMSYGTSGSLFRSGSRQTFFATQVTRYADIYAASVLNMLYYPTFYMFRAPAMLLPHESTVSHENPLEQDVFTGRQPTPPTSASGSHRVSRLQSVV